MELSESKKIIASNKTAAFHIYADLCEVHNYAQVTAHFSDAIQIIYFEAKLKQNQTYSEFILPIDEKKNEFNLDLILYLTKEINENFKLGSQIKRIRVGIVSVDYTTVYYDFSTGLDSPFTKNQLSKTNQNDMID